MLAYRGTDGKLYAAIFAGGAWMAPAGVGGLLIGSTPAVTRGVGAAAAELVYADPNGIVSHMRLVGGAWMGPFPVAMGTGFFHVALSSGP